MPKPVTTKAKGPPPAKLLLSPREAAAALSISERKLWGLTNSGEIPVFRLGRMVRYDVTDVQRFIDEHKHGPHAFQFP